MIMGACKRLCVSTATLNIAQSPLSRAHIKAAVSKQACKTTQCAKLDGETWVVFHCEFGHLGNQVLGGSFLADLGIFLAMNKNGEL